MATKSFTLIVEEEPKIELEVAWDGKSVPELLVTPDGVFLIKVARYLSPGDRYCFRRAVPVYLPYNPPADHGAGVSRDPAGYNAAEQHGSKWNVFKVDALNVRPRYLGYVFAPDAPNAIERGAKCWPRERDSSRPQYGFHVEHA